MHLLAATPGAVLDGSAAVDLEQTPADMVFLSAADTELACLAAAHDRLQTQGQTQVRGQGHAPTLRLANLMALAHPYSVDLYLETVAARARLVVVRVLGGVRYWPYGLEQLSALCRSRAIAFAALPGDDQPDPELMALSTLPTETVQRLWHYGVQGGVDNAVHLLNYAAALLGRERAWQEPRPLLRAALYWPGLTTPDLDSLTRQQWCPGAPVAGLVFYRALLQAGDTATIDALVAGLRHAGLNPLPVAVTSLKEPVAAALLARLFTQAPPDIILNATAFAVGRPGADGESSPSPAETPPGFAPADCPVLQVVLAGCGEAVWREASHGLPPRDLAMHVALPEVDGRILSRAVGFKAEARRHEATESWVTVSRPLADRVAFTASLAAAWVRLRRTPAAQRRVAIILANYPNREGRMANGVGLDTPASVVEALAALAGAGYAVAEAPTDTATLMAQFPVPADAALYLPLAAYQAFLAPLPAPARARLEAAWGAPESDPLYDEGRGFRLPVRRFGGLVVAVQPARGYDRDPLRTYHSPDLVPPHAYLAFYAWLRLAEADGGYGAHAVVHFGKHGNLEWLPGKSLALSDQCWPEIALGPLPNLYPFIVNDPGEGSQAKRRSAAVILDHLTPPLTRAGSYGPLQEMESLVDEYFEAAGTDPRRLPLLRERILELAHVTGLDADCGIAPEEEATTALAKLDAHLCSLKELQIRDGLHIFGVSPLGDQRLDLLVSLARVPRRLGEGPDASLLRALSWDLGLAAPDAPVDDPDATFDPLDTPLHTPWTGPRPATLAAGLPDASPWRTRGDTVERLEALARALVAGQTEAAPEWARTRMVLAWIATRLAPAVDACGRAETAGLLRGLDGRFVAPGPSGAPSRGRPEVLPTGRNFYSVDTRTVPTPAAWRLGWDAAGRLVTRYLQEHGDWPRTLALSAWGTANMRTGGDDVAQAMALLGVRPTWDTGSGRVSGFEILPLSVLDRPRVDVTLRISGFFRDAFPTQIDLFDSAVRAVAALDEDAEQNPLAARVRQETTERQAAGSDAAEAAHLAGLRVFGAMPGAYGAGLQSVLEGGGWTDQADIAATYLAWGSYAYGAGSHGSAAREVLEQRLSQVQVVVQNQDNREHDLLDSDDYYQFEGGLAATVRVLSGTAPTVYHGDHSRPDSPQIYTLEEEIARIVRGRVVNPKWIGGAKRHGYKGACEMAATVDYLFAFAATARCVGNHHFDAVYDAYLADDDTRAFLAEANPAALKDMAARLLEAQTRGLWQSRSNSARGHLEELLKGG